MIKVKNDIQQEKQTLGGFYPSGIDWIRKNGKVVHNEYIKKVNAVNFINLLSTNEKLLVFLRDSAKIKALV